MRISDWSSDVCSSDLADDEAVAGGARLLQQGHVAGVQQVETAVGEADLEPGLTPAGDLSHQAVEVGHLGFGGEQFLSVQRMQDLVWPRHGGAELADHAGQTGRASCRARECPYVSNSVAAGQ